MSEFNFASLASTQAVSNTQKRLNPWGIYTVKFAGARKETIQGRKDPSKTYEILKVRFENEDGYYEESIFYPEAGDDARTKGTRSDGSEYEIPSRFEKTMTSIAHIAGVLNPDGWKKMQAASVKFKSFDDVVTAFIKITDAVKGKETGLKLTGKTQEGRIVPCLPLIASVSREGKVYPASNFLGDKLFFSAYEQGKANEYHNATPTQMPSTTTITAQNVDTSDAGDIDFESLL